MRSYKPFLLPLAAALKLAAAGDDSSTWQQWATPTVTVTSKYTETQYQTKTNYITVTGPTTTQTEYKTSTQYNTITQFNTVTSTVTKVPPPVTSTQYSTITVVPSPLINTVVSTVAASPITTTIFRTTTSTVTTAVVSVANSIVTVPQTIATTVVAPPVTVNNVATITVTNVRAVTVSVPSTCPTPSSGITTCPTRIVNPTYTPPTPLPSNYLWGCPPGYLCHPKRENCNFEQNLPAKSYVCSPDQCLPVANIPRLQNERYLETLIQQKNSSCAFLTPVDDYFNLNPLNFGLDFGIFNIYGQPTCTPDLPATASVTVTLSCPSPVSSTWGTWNSPVASTPVPVTSVTTWNNWDASHTGPAPSKVTKRAELADRDLNRKQVLAVPSECYPACNQAMAVWQSIGLESTGCNDFNAAFATVTDCTNRFNPAEDVTSVASSLNDALLQCRTPSRLRRMTDEELADIIKGKAPAFRFARG